MSGSVWGDSNTHNFFSWCDKCQTNTMRQKNLKYDILNNFNEISNPKSIQAKENLFKILLENKKISIQTLYNILPINLATNPTTKNLIMQLYYENKIKLNSKSDGDREFDFTILCIKKIDEKRTEKITKVRGTINKQQSNVEDMLDYNWKATGRKLEFKKKILGKENINIDLKKEEPKNDKVINQKAIDNIRNLLEKYENKPKNNFYIQKPLIPDIKEPIKEELVVPFLVEKEEKKETFIQQKLITIKKEVPIYKKIEKNDYTIFAKLKSSELFLLSLYFRDALKYEKNITTLNKNEIINNMEYCSKKAMLKYLEEKHKKQIRQKIFATFMCLLILPIPFVVSIYQNPEQRKAKKIYKHQKKRFSYEQIKNNLHNKYPEIVK